MQTTGDLGYLDYGARMYDAGLGRWFGVDPLGEKRYGLSLYQFCQNNSINRVDSDGMFDNPIYDKFGYFLGTDNWGLQGDAFIMNRSDFVQGMSHGDVIVIICRNDILPEYLSSFHFHLIVENTLVEKGKNVFIKISENKEIKLIGWRKTEILN